MVHHRLKERRSSMRFDKVFAVLVASENFAEVSAVCRNISQGGMYIEMPFPIPIGEEIRVRFEMPDCPGAILVRASVKRHYSFNYGTNEPTKQAARGMGIRFLEFLEESDERLRLSLKSYRTLH